MECHDGIDFQYSSRADSAKLTKFVSTTIVSRTKKSDTLISHDERNNKSNTKHTIVMELAPICKDDLVVLPTSLSK